MIILIQLIQFIKMNIEIYFLNISICLLSLNIIIFILTFCNSLYKKKKNLTQLNTSLKKMESELIEKEKIVNEKESQLIERELILKDSYNSLNLKQKELNELDTKLKDTHEELMIKEIDIQNIKADINKLNIKKNKLKNNNQDFIKYQACFCLFKLKEKFNNITNKTRTNKGSNNLTETQLLKEIEYILNGYKNYKTHCLIRKLNNINKESKLTLENLKELFS